jgi:uracil phosphoribosyltransferase
MTQQYFEIQHPLLQHKLGYLRDKETKSSEFRRITKDIARLLTYEALRTWGFMKKVTIETPIAKTEVLRLDNAPVVVSIMRAGNPVMEAALELIPFAAGGHIGIYRDKFIKNTVEYYFKLPDNVEGRPILLCDPLIATADTMIAALDRLKDYKVGPIRVISFLVSENALEKLFHFHPEIEIYALQKEQSLNEKGYLIPGLGDMGDRLFETL